MNQLLILDDDPEVLNMLCRYLMVPGVGIIGCSEIEAAECIVQHLQPRVLITDLEVSLLGGIEGMRLIRYVATHFPEIIIYVLSGHIHKGIQNMGLEFGATEVFRKPMDLERLRNLVWSRLLENETVRGTDRSKGEYSIIEPLESVLLNKDVSMVFQPIVTLSKKKKSYEVYGVESLIRGPKNSLLHHPEILFAYAAGKEKLFELDILSIEMALSQSKSINSGGKYFVNVQPRSMSHPAFVERLQELIERSALTSSDIVLELTEQRTILNPNAFRMTMDAIRKEGLKIALDDYGSGYSNLHLVQELQPDYLKIDGYLCRDIHLDKGKQIIVQSTVEMAQKLNIITIIEQVESDKELEVIKALGIELAQGYLFGRPCPAAELQLQQVLVHS